MMKAMKILGKSVWDKSKLMNNTRPSVYSYHGLNCITAALMTQKRFFYENTTYAWQSGDELDVLVLTGRGNQFITQVVAP